MRKLVRIASVRPIEGFNVELTFTDGSKKTVDLAPYLRGRIFESIRNDQAIFNAVKVDGNSGTICWQNGADIDPDVLFYGLQPAWAEPEKV